MNQLVKTTYSEIVESESPSWPVVPDGSAPSHGAMTPAPDMGQRAGQFMAADEALRVLNSFPDGQRLVNSWGAAAPQNMALAQAEAVAILSDASFSNPAAAQKLMNAYANMSDAEQCAVIESLALRGKERAAGHAPPTLEDFPAMTADDDNPSVDETIDRYTEMKLDALARGDRARANRLDAEQHAYISSRKGNAPIVGGRGRTA